MQILIHALTLKLGNGWVIVPYIRSNIHHGNVFCLIIAISLARNMDITLLPMFNLISVRFINHGYSVQILNFFEDLNLVPKLFRTIVIPSASRSIAINVMGTWWRGTAFRITSQYSRVLYHRQLGCFFNKSSRLKSKRHENFAIYWPLVRGPTGDRWIPLTKGQL